MSGSVFNLGVRLKSHGTLRLASDMNKAAGNTSKFNKTMGNATQQARHFSSSSSHARKALRKMRPEFTRATFQVNKLTQGFSALKGQGLMKIMSAVGLLALATAPLTRGFGELESQITRVGIVSGNSGKQLENYKETLYDFTGILGRLTEYSPKEVGSAAYQIASSGMSSISDIKALLPVVLSIGRMSSQTVSLGDASTLLVQMISKLHGQFGLMEKDANKYLNTMERANRAVDMLGKTVKLSLFKMKDFQEFFRALGASTMMTPTTGLSQYLALGTALKGAGATTAEAGQGIMGFVRRTTVLNRQIEKLEERLERMAAGKSVRRIRKGGILDAIKQIGLTQSDLRTAEGDIKPIFELIDLFKEKIEVPQFDNAKRLQLYIQLFTQMGAKTMLSYGAMEKSVKIFNKETGETETLVLKGAEAMRYLSAEIKFAEGTQRAFNREIMETQKYKTKLMKGSLETLMISIGKIASADVKVITDKFTNILNLIIRIAKNNANVVKGIIKWGTAGIALWGLVGVFQLLFSISGGFVINLGKRIVMMGILVAKHIYLGSIKAFNLMIEGKLLRTFAKKLGYQVWSIKYHIATLGLKAKEMIIHMKEKLYMLGNLVMLKIANSHRLKQIFLKNTSLRISWNLIRATKTSIGSQKLLTQSMRATRVAAGTITAAFGIGAAIMLAVGAVQLLIKGFKKLKKSVAIEDKLKDWAGGKHFGEAWQGELKDFRENYAHTWVDIGRKINDAKSKLESYKAVQSKDEGRNAQIQGEITKWEKTLVKLKKEGEEKAQNSLDYILSEQTVSFVNASNAEIQRMRDTGETPKENTYKIIPGMHEALRLLKLNNETNNANPAIVKKAQALFMKFDNATDAMSKMTYLEKFMAKMGQITDNFMPDAEGLFGGTENENPYTKMMDEIKEAMKLNTTAVNNNTKKLKPNELIPGILGVLGGLDEKEMPKYHRLEGKYTAIALDPLNQNYSFINSPAMVKEYKDRMGMLITSNTNLEDSVDDNTEAQANALLDKKKRDDVINKDIQKNAEKYSEKYGIEKKERLENEFRMLKTLYDEDTNAQGFFDALERGSKSNINVNISVDGKGMSDKELGRTVGVEVRKVMEQTFSGAQNIGGQVQQ